jgi:tetrahydromethanopterin S-methyltransferase subunit A
MIRWTPLLIAIAALAACSPPPRSADYFIAHPEEAVRVVAGCTRGAHRGEECVNATAGVAAAESAERMKLYKKSF